MLIPITCVYSSTSVLILLCGPLLFGRERLFSKKHMYLDWIGIRASVRDYQQGIIAAVCNSKYTMSAWFASVDKLSLILICRIIWKNAECKAIVSALLTVYYNISHKKFYL